MTLPAETASGREPADENRCWCCGKPYPDAELLHLGAHPEAAVCPTCAHFLHREARARADADRPTRGWRVRRAIAVVRRWVIERGLQHKPIIGPLLRRLNRRLP